MPAPQYMVQQPFSHHPQGGRREGRGGAEDTAAEATHLIETSCNLLNDTQQSILVSPQPGLKQKTLSESL